jgi:hypothetical protein
MGWDGGEIAKTRTRHDRALRQRRLECDGRHLPQARRMDECASRAARRTAAAALVTALASTLLCRVIFIIRSYQSRQPASSRWGRVFICDEGDVAQVQHTTHRRPQPWRRAARTVRGQQRPRRCITTTTTTTTRGGGGGLFLRAADTFGERAQRAQALFEAGGVVDPLNVQALVLVLGPREASEMARGGRCAALLGQAQLLPWDGRCTRAQLVECVEGTLACHITVIGAQRAQGWWRVAALVEWVERGRTGVVVDHMQLLE